MLPSRVLAPGSRVAPLSTAAARHSGLSPACVVCSGTTDSIAAFVAANVSRPGQAVTSLGSTLAVKMLSETRIDDALFGVYSHRLGASKVVCQVSPHILVHVKFVVYWMEYLCDQSLIPKTCLQGTPGLWGAHLTLAELY